MGHILTARRRHIRLRGRTMTLRRQIATSPVAWQDVTLTAFDSQYAAQELIGGLIQGDKRVDCLADEMLAAGWPLPPGSKDVLIMDGARFTVQGADTIYEGETLVGFTLWVRGG